MKCRDSRASKPGETLRATALRGVEATQFYPAWGKARLHGMIANRPDWTLSRQRQWGVPMPFFIRKETGELHPRTLELLEEVAQRVERGGIEAWQTLDPVDLLGADAPYYEKIKDTLDVWFDSGSTHFTVLRGSHQSESEFPADLYLEGSDQHRGWFHSSLLVSSMMDGIAPYRSLLTHGFVIDGTGHKMSKSQGNTLAPQKVMDELGADILRLWVAATDYSGELSLSKEILKRVVESYRRIRNTLRFLLANLADFDLARHALPVEDWLEIDRYAVVMTHDLQRALTASELGVKKPAAPGHYGNYEFHLVAQKLQTFCSEELGGFYLDILKDRLYTAPANSRARRSAQNALYHITQCLTRLLAPILSFTAQEVWEVLNGGRRASSSRRGMTSSFPPMRIGCAADGSACARCAWTCRRSSRRCESPGKSDHRSQAKSSSTQTASRRRFLRSFDDDLRFVFITSQARLGRSMRPRMPRALRLPV